MNLRRGLVAGFSWGLAGLIGPPVMIAAFTLASWWFNDTQPVDRRYHINWWRWHAFPGVVVIPMLLFFAGLVTYMPKRYVGLAKNLAILAVTAFPLAAILGAMGMAHPRYKSMDHPPMYSSEVLMFLILLAAISFILIAARQDASCKGRSTTDELPNYPTRATEQSHAPEPAARPVSSGESSPPAQ